jgi:hypothetical protein
MRCPDGLGAPRAPVRPPRGVDPTGRQWVQVEGMMTAATGKRSFQQKAVHGHRQTR